MTARGDASRVAKSLVVFALSLVVTLAMGRREAYGQPVPLAPSAAPSADDAKEGKRHFTVGNDLYRDGRFQDAVVEFDASYRLGGRPSALRNGADCRRQLNEYADAYDAYQVLLSRHRSQLSAADQVAVQKAIDELDALTGLLSVSANEEGAEIVVDDRVLARTPLATKLRLSVGRHKLVVRKAGFVAYAPADDVVLISKQTVTVDAKLVPEVVTGHVSVREASGRDVHVFVDDADKGAAPWEGDLAPGPHRVDARGARFAATAQTVTLTLERGQRLEVVVNAFPTSGRLRITAQPDSATISIDGKPVDNGSWEGELAPGPHHVEVTAGTAHAERDVVVERGETAVQEIPLEIERPADRGPYGRVAMMTMLPLTSSSIINSVPGVVSVDAGGRLGGGGMLFVGYSFGPLSAELAGAFLFTGGLPAPSYNLTGQQITNGGPCTHGDVKVQSVNGFVGPGIRATSQGETLRFTANLALGTAIRRFTATRECGGTQFSGAAGYVDGAILFDAGILLGGTPGAKFWLGIEGWADFPVHDVVVGPDTSPELIDAFFSAQGRGYRLASGPQVLLGPTLGIQIGH